MHARRRDGTPPTLIALHGMAGTGADWEPLLQPFPNALLLPDLPGHGESRRHETPGFEELSDQLSGLAASGPAVWIGYSLGARILLHHVLRHPSTVHALVVVGAHPGISSLAERLKRRHQDELDARLLEERGLETFLSAWHERPPFQTRRQRPGWFDEVLRKRATNEAQALAGVLRRLGLGSQADLRPLLPRIPCPVLWVTGALDEPYTRLAQECVPLLPQGRHAALPGAGHGAHLEEPQAFQDALRRFLAESARDARGPIA